ncbi:hypothetical protein QKW52_17115 [Bacillus sonorensis]|nr:hypothetical protein [Bacillus sonorensis]
MNTKRQKRRLQIIEDAIQVLAEEGYANASIGNIAKKGESAKESSRIIFRIKCS